MCFHVPMKIKVRPYSDKKKPHLNYVCSYTVCGKRKRKFFGLKTKADNWAKDKEAELENLGRSASGLSDEIKREALVGTEKLQSYGASISDATTHYIDYLKANANSDPVGELVPLFIEYTEEQGKAKRTVDDYESRLKPFSEDFKDRLASSISKREIVEWIKNRKGGSVNKNHYRRCLSAFFTWCEMSEYATHNPIKKIQKRKVVDKTPEIFTVEELSIILREAVLWASNERYEAHAKEILPVVLIGTFAGIRPGEIARMKREYVNLKTNKIDLRALFTKGAKRRIVDIKEPLASWLREYFPSESGPVLVVKGYEGAEKNFREHLRDNCGVEWKYDGLRHSYASYMMAITNDPGYVSLQMGHANSRMIFDRYREVVEDHEAEGYLKLLPSNVLNLENCIQIAS